MSIKEKRPLFCHRARGRLSSSFKWITSGNCRSITAVRTQGRAITRSRARLRSNERMGAPRSSFRLSSSAVFSVSIRPSTNISLTENPAWAVAATRLSFVLETNSWIQPVCQNHHDPPPDIATTNTAMSPTRVGTQRFDRHRGPLFLRWLGHLHHRRMPHAPPPETRSSMIYSRPPARAPVRWVSCQAECLLQAYTGFAIANACLPKTLRHPMVSWAKVKFAGPLCKHAGARSAGTWC